MDETAGAAARRESEFEAALRADGFAEVVRRDAPPGGDRSPHDHGWDVRGLVVRGRFTVDSFDRVQSCGPGEIFTLAAGTRHIEYAGEEGAALLVGRRHRAAG